MTLFSDEQIYYLGSELIVLLVGVYLLYFLVRGLGASRPGLAIGAPIAAAFAVRLLAAIGLEQTSFAQELRGGDELTFLFRAQDIADEGLSSEASLDALTSELHTFVFSVFKGLLEPTPEFMLRILVIAVAVAGIALLATAVWELAGAQAASLAAWIVAFEPTHVFFSGILHKEPFMFLAEGLLAFGGARLWNRGQYAALVPLTLGCLLAVATRPYVGWFFLAAAAAMVLHAAIRRRRAGGTAALVAAGLLLTGVFVPIAWDKSSDRNLEDLQSSQDANASDTSANLSFEEIDYSTRENVILNLPSRMWDVVSRPYPWQIENTSQRLGLVGTIVMIGGLLYLAGTVIRNGRGVMQRAGPLLYPALFALVAYSLSAGNAGTAFRYRTHVVALMLCALVALRAHRAQERAEHARIRRSAGFLPVAPRSGSTA